MLLFPLVAALLGEGLGAGMLFGSLLIHEFAHAAAAHVLHVAMSEIRLTPFGGAARIENPYAVSAPRVFAVAAAGPAANLLALLACGAMRPLWPAAPLAELMRVNGMLMAFNLLPALPLDGGRMTYALLSAKLAENARSAHACGRGAGSPCCWRRSPDGDGGRAGGSTCRRCSRRSLSYPLPRTSAARCRKAASNRCCTPCVR